MTVSESQLKKNAEAIVTELEQRAQANLHALNSRDFSPSSALYYMKMDSWRTKDENVSDSKELGLEEYVRGLEQLTSNYPELKGRMIDINTTVNSQQDIARMYVNVEITGMPPGIVRQTVAFAEMRLVSGVWMGYSHRGVAGTGVMALT